MKPKMILYARVDPKSEYGVWMYQMLADLIRDHHPDLATTQVKITLLWWKGRKPDRDDITPLARTRKSADLEREFHDSDFAILVNEDAWENLNTEQRTALLDHELCHCAVATDPETDEPRYDEQGRPVFRVRRHDVEEFHEIVERHGFWTPDLKDFDKKGRIKQGHLFPAGEKASSKKRGRKAEEATG